VWNSRVPGARNHSIKRPQQECGLVGSRFENKFDAKFVNIASTLAQFDSQILIAKFCVKYVLYNKGILLFEMLAGYPPFYDENPFGIYQKILAGRIDFSHGFDEKAKSLIKKLLCADRTKRYGCLKRGAADVKDHKFFSSFNWEDCRARKDAPPATILNKITAMFGVKRPEDIDRHATVCFDEFEKNHNCRTKFMHRFI